MTDINEDAAPKAKRTLSPEHKAKLAAGRQRAVQSGPQSATVADPVREPPSGISYTAEGRAIVTVNGETLTRKRPDQVAQFEVPLNFIPHDMEYQWNVITVTGEPQTDAQINMAENGWRPVPSGRHPGMFMPAGTPPNEAIVRGGLRLEERPKILSDEARRDEARKAGQLVKDQVEQLGLAAKLPSGFSRENSQLHRMERAGTSRTYAPEPSIARPQLPIDPAA